MVPRGLVFMHPIHHALVASERPDYREYEPFYLDPESFDVTRYRVFWFGLPDIAHSVTENVALVRVPRRDTTPGAGR